MLADFREHWFKRMNVMVHLAPSPQFNCGVA
jgi:hypothetical protein